MIDENGRETEAVDVMRYVWPGQWPRHRAPRVTGIDIDGLKAVDNVRLKPRQACSAAIAVEYNGDDNLLRYDWEVLHEPTRFGYGGQGESKPSPVAGLVLSRDRERTRFIAPTKPGALPPVNY